MVFNLCIQKIYVNITFWSKIRINNILAKNLNNLRSTLLFDIPITDGEMQKDINVDNPLGSGGKLAVSFAMLLRILWSGKHYSFSPSKLKVL